MKRVALFAALLVAVALQSASADVPSTMSYQGVLTDGGGQIVPDGNYTLEFNIYNVAVAGAPLWTETHVGVPVSLGGFSVILGSNTPLALPFDEQYWLGVSVNGNPELAPRVPLASSPYGLSLRLPFAGSASSPDPLIQLENTGTGPELSLGSTTDSAELWAWVPGSPFPNAWMYNFAGGGMALDFYDESGNGTHFIEPDVDGDGGFLSVISGNGGEGFVVDGKSGVGGNTRVFIGGGMSATTFDTNNLGDASISLPADAVSADEMLDEAGISQGKYNGQFDLSDGELQDIVTTTITIPADGYIFVTASGQHGLSNSSGSNVATFQIDETAGGFADANHYYYSGFDGIANFSGGLWNPVQLQRTYYKTAGTYTFRLEGSATAANGTSWMWNAVITAVYVPTGYGTVSESVTPLAVGDFSDVTYTNATGNGAGSGASGQGAIVDLRELELRAARLRAQTREAELELLKAQQGQSRERKVWNAQAGN